MTVTASQSASFASVNAGYDAVFRPGRMSIGLVVPIEAYPDGPVPMMTDALARVRLAEELGFAAVWLRDVPFNVPSFGDAGQVYDPFVYLGYLAAQTHRLALGVASIILPLRHPGHVAKAAASVDQLSGGRLILGIASGDRPEEYPAFGQPFAERGAEFRARYRQIRRLSEDAPTFDTALGRSDGGIDLLPKPAGRHLPLLITGGSQQSPQWLADHGDGWMIYPRNPSLQGQIIEGWRGRIRASGGADKPVMQPLYIDLLADPDALPQPIHLGLRLGSRHLRTYLDSLQKIGVNHVALNLRFNRANIEQTLTHLAEDILPDFHGLKEQPMPKTIVITGATDGIGQKAAELLVSAGHHVLVHGRNPDKLARTCKTLSALPGGGRIDGYKADLSRKSEIEALAQAIAADHSTLDGLINNAGVFNTPHPITADGIDVRFVVNTIAPFLLAERLFERLGPPVGS